MKRRAILAEPERCVLISCTQNTFPGVLLRIRRFKHNFYGIILGKSKQWIWTLSISPTARSSQPLGSFNLGQNEGIYFSDSFWNAICGSISMSARILANFMWNVQSNSQISLMWLNITAKYSLANRYSGRKCIVMNMGHYKVICFKKVFLRLKFE